MRPSDVLGIVAGIAGGLPPLHLPKRRERKPDPVAEAAATAKRARRAAKRAEDERRTAAGRAPLWVRLRPRRAFWDWCEWRIRNGSPTVVEPRWRIRSRERRANPALYMRDRGAL